MFLFFIAQKVQLFFASNIFHGRTNQKHLNMGNFQTFDSNICIYLFATNWVKVGEQTINSIDFKLDFSMNYKPLQYKILTCISTIYPYLLSTYLPIPSPQIRFLHIQLLTHDDIIPDIYTKVTITCLNIQCIHRQLSPFSPL